MVFMVLSFFLNVLLVWGNFRLTGFRSFKGFEGYKDFDGLRIFKEVIWGVMIGGVLGALKGALKGIKWFICFRDLRRRRAGKRWAEGDGRVRARAARGGWARAKARGGSERGGGAGGVWGDAGELAPRYRDFEVPHRSAPTKSFVKPP